MARAVQKLQRLHGELDFANAAIAKLNVPVQIFDAHEIALNAKLKFRDFGQKIIRDGAGEDERLETMLELVKQLFIAGNSTRFLKCHPLPSFAVAGIIILYAG